MKLQKKKNNTTYIALGVAAGFHLLLGLIFWDQIKEIIGPDTTLEVSEGDTRPPPPPPPPPPPKLDIEKPTIEKPIFDLKSPVNTASKVPAFDIDFGSKLAGGPDMAEVAMGSGLDIEDAKIGLDLVSTSISAAIGFGDLSMDPSKARSRTKVMGKGRRMQGIIPVVFLASDENKKHSERGQWNYFWNVAYEPFEAINRYFLDETNLRLSDKAKNVDLSVNATMEEINKKAAKLKYGFDREFINLILRSQGKKTPQEVKTVSLEPELVALERIKALSSAIASLDFSLGMNHIDILRLILKDYHEKKYNIKEVNLDEPRKLAETIVKETRQNLRKWRTDYLVTLSAFLENKKDEEITQSDLNIPYIYLKKAEALLSPILFSQAFYGIEISRDENIDILINYLKNGGMLYLTDPTEDKDALQKNRSFVRSLITKLDGVLKLDANEKKALEKLRKEDTPIPGYKLIETKREFPHPKIPIEFEIPAREFVTVTVFNRQGKKVRTILDNYMQANSYTYARKKSVQWDATDDEGHDLSSGLYFIQMRAGIFQQTVIREISRLRLVNEQKHPLFSSYFNLGAIPVALQSQDEQFKEDGIHAYQYSYQGRMTIFYSEGLGELHGFGKSSVSGNEQQRAFWAKSSARWMANFFAYALVQENSITLWPG